MTTEKKTEPLWRRLIRPSLLVAFYIPPLYPVFIFFVNIFQRLTGKYLGDRQYIAQRVEEFADEKKGDKILQVLPAQEVEIPVPAYWDLEGNYHAATSTKVMSEPVYFCELKGVEVMESNSIVTRDGKALFPDWFSAKAARNNFRSYFRVLASSGNRILLSRNKPSIDYPACFYIGGRASNNYYHWVLEFLPKLFFLQNTNINTPVTILADESIKASPQLVKLLACFTEREIVFIPQGKASTVEQLYWSNSFLQMTHDLKNGLQLQPSDCVIEPEIVKQISSTILKRVVLTQKETAPYIYISKHVKNSRNFNEEDVISTLTALNFQTVYPEDLSFEEQVLLFQSAKIIVGATGAWLTNVMFSNREQTVLYFTWFTEETIFSPLAFASGAKLEKLIVERESDTIIHTDFKVDTTVLSEVVRSIIEKQKTM